MDPILQAEGSTHKTKKAIAQPPGVVPAFPGAEGFAAMVTGGRGGRVLKVTTLASRGPGSLQQALNAPGPRIVVFAVSGIIDADVIEIPHGSVTLAGQTAPGAGITIRGRLNNTYGNEVDNIIIRHIRVRPAYDGSPGHLFDALGIGGTTHIIVDHVSASFAVDETVDLWQSHDVTVQWSTIESSARHGHPEGEHNYGLINGPEGGRVSILYNLFAHHKNRSPAIATGPAEVRNNVVYNVKHGFIHHNPAAGQFNLVGNYFKTGPSSLLIPFYFDDENSSASPGLSYYLEGNLLDGKRSPCPEGAVDDPWRQCSYDPVCDRSHRSESEFDFSVGAPEYRAPTKHTAREAYELVMAQAGAFPRDVVTLRTVHEAETRTGAWGSRLPADWMAGLTTVEPPVDSDNDGMADVWERAHGLDPIDGNDHSTVMASGYTAVEEYINELADRLPVR